MDAQPFKYQDFSGGQANNLNKNLRPTSTVELLMNCDCDEEIGSVSSRLGTAQIGSQLVDNEPILGLHQHVDHANSSNNKLFAAINASGDATSVIYNAVAGSTVLTGLTASKKYRFLTYGGQTIFLNGADSPYTYNNNAWVKSATFTGATNDTITSNGHGLLDTDRISLTTDGTLPAGLSTGVVYYVISATTNTFSVSLTRGGSAVDITDTGSGTHTWHFEGVFTMTDLPGTNPTLIREFLDRVYIAGDTAYPDRLYFSGIFDGENVNWLGDYIDIEPEDGGGAISALGKVPGYLIIFKERSFKRFTPSSAFPETLVNIGTPYQECVVEGAGLIAFFSSSNQSSRGFYVSNGERPVPISHDNTRPIKKWVDAIPQASETKICGWAEDRHFCWSVGDLTVDGETYNNVVLRYNHVLNQWSVRYYPTEFRKFATYIVSGVNTVVGGDDDGNVIHVDKPTVYTDAPSTTPIPWKMRTFHDDFGSNKLKALTDRAIVRGRGLEGSRTHAFVDRILDPISLQKSFFKRVLGLFGIDRSIEGTTISLQVSGETTGERAYVEEIEIMITPRDAYAE